MRAQDRREEGKLIDQSGEEEEGQGGQGKERGKDGRLRTLFETQVRRSIKVWKRFNTHTLIHHLQTPQAR